MAGKLEIATGAERPTEPVTVGIQFDPETIQGDVPCVTDVEAGKFETATGPESPTDPVMGPESPTEPVIGTGFDPATATPPTKSPTTDPERSVTF